MKSFMDEVTYNEQGNEVVMCRRWSGDASKPVAPKPQSVTRQPKLLGKLNCNKTGKEVEMTVDKFMLGRQKSCHLVIPFQSVAENHCLLIHDGGNWYAKNMSNQEQGTLINGEPIDYNKIENGDQLTIGTYDYKIEY